jgi:hypothetical protein
MMVAYVGLAKDDRQWNKYDLIKADDRCCNHAAIYQTFGYVSKP